MNKILLIEQEQVLGEMYRDAFEGRGFEFLFTDNAEKGLKIVKEQRPDLILVDILSFESPGIPFLFSLKKDPDLDPEIKNLPVIVLSNYEQGPIPREVSKLGVEDYLVNTYFTPAELIERVKKLLIT